MQTSSKAATLSAPFLSVSRTKRRDVRAIAGRTITALPVLFLLFDVSIKLIGIPAVAESMTRLGYSPDVALTIGVIEFLCLAVYLVPRSAIIGAVLLTGFLGGAVATHVRVSDPLFSHMLFPVYVAAMLWAGLYLRDARLRTVIHPTQQR